MVGGCGWAIGSVMDLLRPGETCWRKERAGRAAFLVDTEAYFTAVFEALRKARRSVLLLGYAGWGEGQLEEELADNVWLTADADLDLIFDGEHTSKWTRALAQLGVDAAMLSSQGGRA